MAADNWMDDIDAAILNRLRANARESATAIGSEVGLSPAAVRKRIQRLRDQGVIKAFTVVVDHRKLEPRSVEAYIEVTFAANVDVASIVKQAVRNERVREASTIAGDPDAIVRVRVRSLAELRDVVIWLRETFEISRTKALVVLDRERHIYTDTEP